MKMELLSKFPKDFFDEPLPEATPGNNPDDKIIPIKWNKDVKNGKKKALVKLKNKKKR